MKPTNQQLTMLYQQLIELINKYIKGLPPKMSK